MSHRAESQTASSPATERRLLLWSLAAAALLCAAMAVPLLAGRVYVADDLGAYHLPLRAFYAQQLQAGEPFDWLPSLFSGFYLSGEGQAGTYHPLHLVLYRFLPLTVAFDLELLISYPLMLWGSYLLLARWLARRDAALLGALVFTFSGFNLLHFVHPNAVAVVAHWPWLLWAIDRALVPQRGLSQFCEVRAAKWNCPPSPRGGDLRDRFSSPTSPWAFALISLLLGSEILIGYPQYVWIGLLVAVPYSLVCVAKSFGNTAGWRQLAFLFSAGVAGLLLGGIQLIPSIDALNDSTRQSADGAFATSGSLHPLNLVQIVAPYLFTTRVVGQNTHELGLYFGAVPLLLTVWLLAHRSAWGDCRRLIVAALWVAGIAFLLALGEHGIVGAWQQYLPLVGKFRFPCRSIVWVYAAVALLAAIAWQRLVAAPPAGRSESQPTSSAAIWAVSLLVALIAPSIWPEYVSSWSWIVAGPLWFGAGAIAIVAAERGARAAPAALILLTMLDLGSYGLSYSVWPHTALLADFARPQDAPPNADRPIVAQPIDEGADDLQVGNRLLLAGFLRADGYAGLVPLCRLDFRDPNALRVAGVGFFAERSGPDESDPIRWSPVSDPLPLARLVTRAIADQGGPFPPDAAAIDAALVEPAPGGAPFMFTPAAKSTTTNPDSRQSSSEIQNVPVSVVLIPHNEPASPGTITDLDQRSGRLSLNAETESRQLLVVATRFHSGWQAAIDGRSIPVLRVNRDFLGCVIEPGKHRVTLDFHPFSLQLGRVLSTLGLGLLCAQWVVAAWLGRRSVVRRSAAPQTVTT